MSEELNWEEAKERLNTLQKRYSELPASSGWFGIAMLNKLKKRYLNGERTEKLYNEIMNFKM